jgi:tetratricopeptide (TPR) repeat protein
VFDHHQVQEALYEGLHDQLREPYHGALADALQARTPDPTGATAVELTEHALKGGRDARYLDGALDHLEGSYQNEAAIRLADRALDGDTLQGEARASVLIRKSRRHWLRGEWKLQQDALEEALDLADAAKAPALRASALHKLAGAPGRERDATAAADMLGEALELATEAEDPGLVSKVTRGLGIESIQLGRLEEATVHFERAAELAHESGEPETEARALANLAAIRARGRNSAEAIADFDRVLALVRQTGCRVVELQVETNLGGLCWGAGRIADAQAHFERARALAQETGFRLGEAYSVMELGALQGTLGRLGNARQHCERALALSSELGKRQEGRAWHGLAEVCEQEGNLQEAVRIAGQRARTARAREDKASLASSLAELARYEITTGDAETALGHLDEALDLARETDSPVQIVMARIERARLSGGDPDAALASLVEHHARVPHEIQMYCRFRLWEATQDTAHIEEAHRLLCFMRDHAPEDDRASMIENVPLHRDIMKAWEDCGEKTE